jgi:hypothetical protein
MSSFIQPGSLQSPERSPNPAAASPCRPIWRRSTRPAPSPALSSTSRLIARGITRAIAWRCGWDGQHSTECRTPGVRESSGCRRQG